MGKGRDKRRKAKDKKLERAKSAMVRIVPASEVLGHPVMSLLAEDYLEKKVG
jgi:hypothetical protein